MEADFMMKKEKKINKTERILGVYYLLRYSGCEVVSFQELSDRLPGWCKKTFSRDIALLKKAGVQIKFSVSFDKDDKDKEKLQGYVLKDTEHTKLPLSENKNKSEVRYIKKIMRLIKMMDEMPEEDCDKWYEDTFFNDDVSKRTMQRDFATLNVIGYRVKYERESYNYHDAGVDLPPGHYYCDRPDELTIFNFQGD
jgi:predicted DNA-binding transcriptional regulator YafY